MTKDIQTIIYGAGRVETGLVQFDDDWPGLFIRGDQAYHFGVTLQGIIDVWKMEWDESSEATIHLAVLEGLANSLLSVNINK